VGKVFRVASFLAVVAVAQPSEVATMGAFVYARDLRDVGSEAVRVAFERAGTCEARGSALLFGL
jgi:hypothetical protein